MSVVASAAVAQDAIPVDRQKVAAVSPALEAFTTEDLFGRVWRGSALSMRDRGLVTVAALISAGHVQQITFHLNRARDNGLSKDEASGMLSHLAFYAGWPNVFSAMPVAKDVFENREG